MMQKCRLLIVCAVSSLLLLPCVVQADVVYVGSVEGAEVQDWRTAGTAKTFDIDGDNVYGSLGGVHWHVGSAGEYPAGSSPTNMGWAYAGLGDGSGQANGGAAYSQVDHVNDPATDVGAGIVYGGVFIFELTGSPGDYAGQVVRVGVMHDVLSSGEWAADQFKGLQLVQTLGGTGDSGVIPLRGGAIGDGVPEMYFFDLSGVAEGDQFEIVGLNNIGGDTGGQVGYLGNVSWDVIPEPASVFLLGLGAVALLARGRRTA